MKNILKKHKVKIIFIIILIFQVITIIYAASKRVHLHMDEYLSFGFISSEDMFINLKEDFYNMVCDSFKCSIIHYIDVHSVSNRREII